MRLTVKQQKALEILSKGPASAYDMKISLGTLNALSLKGLASISAEPGAMVFPHNARWFITDAGRSALNEMG